MRLRTKLFVDYYGGGISYLLLKPLVVAVGWALRRNHDLQRVSRICVIKYYGGGSLVIAYPALLALKRSGRYKLELVTSRGVAGFAKSLGVFDSIMAIDDATWPRLLVSGMRTMAALFRHDAIVDLEVYSRLTVVFGLMTCARNRVGFYLAGSFWRKGLSTHLLFFNPASGIYHYYDQIAVLFGCSVSAFDECRREFRLGLGLNGRTGDGGRHGPGLIGVAPGCSELGEVRRLADGQWVAIIKAAVLAGPPGKVHVEFIGGPNDRDVCDRIVGLLNACPELQGRIVARNQAGTRSLKESLLELDRLDVFYCIDSGLLHFARLLGKKTVSYWGPTDPATRLRQVDPSVDVIHYRKLSCSPCVHVANIPPCRGDNRCVQALTDERAARGENPVWLA